MSEEDEAARPRPVLRLGEAAAEAGGGAGPPSPQDAPEVDADAAEAAAAAAAASGLGTRLSGWARLAAATALSLVALAAAAEIWALIAWAAALAPWAGWAVGALAALLASALAALIGRELAALGRARRVGALRAQIAAAQAAADQRAAAAALARLEALFAGRADLAWAREEAAARGAEAGDPLGRLLATERACLGPLDARAAEEIAAAARLVATATTLAPSALLDGLAALYLNLRMIRRLSQIYGGRGGALAALGLARRTVVAAMAAGLIALGDDLLEPLMGGGIAGRLSRRLGEGVVNGALTARLGLAAMEVCRPAPFAGLSKPALRDLVWEAARGVAARRDGAG